MKGSTVAYGGAAIALIAGLVAYQTGEDEGSLPRLENNMRVTEGAVVGDWPSWSPDETRIAYSHNEDILVARAGAGVGENLTEGIEGSHGAPAWSPDGSKIAFRSSREGGGIFLIPADGGQPQRVANAGIGFGPPCWSPDGSELAFISMDTAVVCTPEGVEKSRRHLPGGDENFRYRGNLSRSPDGKFFAYTVGTFGEALHPAELWLMRTGDGEAKQVTDGKTVEWSPRWSNNGRHLYFVSNRGGSMELWRQRIGNDGAPEGESKKIKNGTGIRSAGFTGNGKKIAYAKGGWTGNVWKVPILSDTIAVWDDAVQLTKEDGLVWSFDFSPDGKHIVFESKRAGNYDIWIITLADGTMKQVTDSAKSDYLPKWSPDSLHLSFVAPGNVKKDIWKISLEEGAKPQQLTKDSLDDWYHAWSPDGDEIAFVSERSGNWDVWIMSSEGGEARRVTDDPGDEFLQGWSPDGGWILFRSSREGMSQLYRTSAAGGGDAQRLTSNGGWCGVISPDGKTIYYTGVGETGGFIWAAGIGGGPPQKVMDLAGKTGRIDVTMQTDGKYIYFVWWETSADIWVADVTEE